jgi:tRNA(fMet)-specific endonuclease VapC
MGLLYDTNILIHIVRDISNTEYVRNFVNPENEAEFISLVTVAEILSISYRKNWSLQKRSNLTRIFSELEIIDIADETLINKYVEIDAFNQGEHPVRKPETKFSAQNMGKNDLWIAATASALELTLITTDNDYNHLHNEFCQIKRYSPEVLKFPA